MLGLLSVLDHSSFRTWLTLNPWFSQLSEADSAVSGSAWHCYAGDSSSQSAVTDTYPTKEIYFTECAGIIGSGWWTDIKWQTGNLWIGAVNNWARAALMWSLVANSDGVSAGYSCVAFEWTRGC
jgi:O-glycosyl hydrolase